VLACCPVVSCAVLQFSKHFWLSPGRKGNVSNHFTARGYPLYNVGPLYFKDLETQVAQLDVRAQLTSYVPVLWKLVQPKFTAKADCTININPQYYVFINSTCRFT